MPNADGSIVIAVDADDKKAQKELDKLNRKIQTLNDQIYDKQQQKIPLVQQAQELGVQLDEAKAKLAALQDSGAPSDAILEQKETVTAIQTKWNNVNREVDTLDRGIDRANISLDRTKEQAGEVQRQMAAAARNTGGLGQAVEQADEFMKRFVKRIKGLALRVFVFSMITSALRSMRSYMAKVIKTNAEATAAIARLKGALLTLAQPIIEVIIPAFTYFINILANVVAAIANFVSMIFGKTGEESAKAAESLYNETEALDATGSAAKKASKSLASFDEINKLSGDTSDSASDAVADSIAPDFSAFETSSIKDKLDEITAYCMAALLAIGAVLCFSGANIPLGLGLMVVGALGLAAVVALNWDTMSDQLRKTLTTIMAALGTFLLVLGSILCFSGANLPLGIGLMVIGAASLATAVALNWDAIVDAIKGPLGVLMGVLSAALLVIGAVLCFSGANIPLGLGLMVVGALGLAAVVALNWDTMSTEMKNVVVGILELLGSVLIVIGAILAFTGANIPLGIGLMIAGAAALAGAAAINWKLLGSSLDEVLGEILLALGTVLLVIGAVFTFSGANLPLGIGLMIAGAASLASAAALNWETIVNELQSPMSILVGLLSGALLVLGAILTFSGAALPLGIALMVAGAAGLVTTVALNWDRIVTEVQGPLGETIAAASAALLALGLILALSGVALPLGIALIAAGAVGLVTASALNWDAILEKLKETWEKIKNWWDADVKKYFTLDYWQDVGKNIIDGFLSGIKNKWDSVISWLSGAVSGLKNKLSSATSGITASATTDSISSKARISVPGLAQGAVIPPNREFMAVLGDQKSGTNIETPLDTMVQAFKQALAESGYGGNGSNTVILEIDGRQFARAVYTANNQETQRIGTRLVEV